MSQFPAIALVTDALERFLTQSMQDVGLNIPARKHMLQPPPAANQPMLTLFLYDVAEDPSLRNASSTKIEVNGTWQMKRPPVPIILRYMLTPWATNAGDAHLMIGCAISALHDARTLLGNDLRALLGGIPDVARNIGDIDVLSIAMTQLTLEDKSKIWWAIQQPFHLSLMYELRVVGIEASAGSTALGAPVTISDLDARFPVTARS